MLNRIIEIAKKFCGEDMEWSGDVSIMSDMALSSMEFFEFICEIEDEFGIKLTERELNRIDSLGDLEEMVKAK